MDEAAVRAPAPSALCSLDGNAAIVTGAAGPGAVGAGILLTDLDGTGLVEVAGVLASAGVRVETLARRPASPSLRR